MLAMRITLRIRRRIAPVSPETAQEAALFKQENQFLRERVGDLKQRVSWLEGLVDRQTAQLHPASQRRGWAARLVGWWRDT